MYVFGGKDAANQPINSIEMLDVRSLNQSWQSITNGDQINLMSTSFPVVAQINSCEICILGGTNSPKWAYLFNVEKRTTRKLNTIPSKDIVAK